MGKSILAVRGTRRVPYKRNTRRSVLNKRKRYNKQFKLVRHVFGGFTPTFCTKLKYVDYADLDASASASAVNVYRVNNPYDPDFTGTGHQPMWWDTYAAIYSQVRVTKATIRMTDLFNKLVNVGGLDATLGTTAGTFTHYGYANERAARMFIVRDETATDYPTNISTLIEEGNTNFTWMWSPMNVSDKMQTLEYTCVPHIQCDMSKRDALLAMKVDGTTPTGFKNLYFICGVASIDSQNNPVTKRVMVEIDYEVEFFDRVTFQAQQ